MEDLLPIRGLDDAVRDNHIIKVVGVGGGGCNAVNYMYRTGIRDVSFLVCNTDSMALVGMDVPAKLQLGPGLGAGGRPEKAHELAEENQDKIHTALDDGTRMVFITAGMGGGTGTGASPVVASVAQKLGILTVGIVTIPFAFEGARQIRKALRGVAQLAQYTDALLVINNEKLRMLFPDFDLPNAFRSSDEVVCNAAKSIAEIITVRGYINTDFQDVYNTLKDGNVAIMNVGFAEGEQRITRAINNALTSPLVNTMDVHGASRILLNFYCSSEHAIRMEELGEVTTFCNSMGEDVEIKWGMSYDETLGEKVKVTIIATGYSVSDIPGLDEAVEVKEPESKTEDVTKRPTVEEAIGIFYGGKEEQPTEEGPTTDENPIEEEIPVEELPIQEEPTAKEVQQTSDDNMIIFGEDITTTDNEPEEDYVPAWKRRRN